LISHQGRQSAIRAGREQDDRQNCEDAMHSSPGSQGEVGLTSYDLGRDIVRTQVAKFVADYQGG
jgi:hypothetical protein